MENAAAVRSIHGSVLSSNGSISSPPPLASPRKQRGVMRTVSSGDASDGASAREKEKSRFFRLLSPKKAMARKAKAKKQDNRGDIPTLTPEMDAIGILPFENKSQGDGAKGRTAVRHKSMTQSTPVTSEIRRGPCHEDSSVGLDEIFLVEEVKTQQNIVLPALSASQAAPHVQVHSARDKETRKSPRRKGPSKPDFQASMDMGDVFRSEQEDTPRQDDELMAMALEKSKKDFRGVPSASPMRKKRIPLQVLDETQSWTAREQRKAKERNTREQRVEPHARSNRGGNPSDEDLRLIEEEQEREMIELALERSLEEAKQRERPGRTVNDSSCCSSSSPHQVPYDRGEVEWDRSAEDEDEVARREEEMIRRAMEMSMRDF